MTTNPDTFTPTLDLNNIQGDILGGLPKKTEVQYFFQVADVEKFRNHLVKFIPFVKTANQVLQDKKNIGDHKKGDGQGLIPMAGVNIAFSHLGFAKMGIDDSSLFNGEDDPFKLGQLKDATKSLGDRSKETPNGPIPAEWEEEFLQPIHGVILVATESHATAEKKVQEIEGIFQVGTPHASIHKVKRIRGDVRPGAQSGHEHFGFLDGISNPAVAGFDKEALPGQRMIRPGIILTGHDGDPIKHRAPWAVDGSFLVFRYLFQQVPEFDNYLKENPIKFKDLTPEEGSELLGARMVGRWKSGAPVDITPFKDDPKLAKDKYRNNDFKFEAQLNSQFKCPFAAHIRKTNPRDDLESLGTPVGPRRILRRGIPFGPEVTPHEKETNKTEKDRGLLFICYQSSITRGFQFQQQSWSNERKFPPGETEPEVPGFDPLIGQPTSEGTVRMMSGLDPKDATKELSFPDFIIPRGGEYFFSPSIKGLRETLATRIEV